jgi:2,6-dihydroxypseudooxynicotine hydrolase
LTDERTAAAVANWAPRFTTQGVDANDFARVTAPLERWEEWLPAWVANGDAHAALAREAEAAGWTLTAGEAWVSAALSYHFAKFVWIVDPAAHDEAEDRAIAALREAHRLLDETAERVEVPFEGGSLVGNLRRPGGSSAPLVLLLPGLDSTKEEFFRWEEVYLRRGLATFSLDGPGQGESARSTRIRPDYEAAVGAALDRLAWEAPVGVAGVSLGGYYAPRALLDRRIAAGVSAGGPFCFGDVWDGLPGLTRETFVHHAGSAERAAELSLAGVAERLEQPLLVIAGDRDRIIPWQDSRRIADAAPNAEWVLIEGGNHVCNNLPYRYRPLAGDWLAERLH